MSSDAFNRRKNIVSFCSAHLPVSDKSLLNTLNSQSRVAWSRLSLTELLKEHEEGFIWRAAG